MLLFVLALMVAALATAWLTVTYFAANLVPLLTAIFAGHAAYLTGSGWIGAIVVGAIVLAISSAALQLAVAFAKPTWLKLLIIAPVVISPAVAAFAMVDASLAHQIPNPLWRDLVASATAIGTAAAAHRRFFMVPSTGVAQSG
jgi:hypothetical protein